MKKFVHSKKSKGFFLMSNVKYLGIDIGGAHFKLVGLDEKKFCLLCGIQKMLCLGRITKFKKRN